jgi:hypothetical protein
MSANKAARDAAREALKKLMSTQEGLTKLTRASQFNLPPSLRSPMQEIDVDANIAIGESLTDAMEVIYGKRLADCVKNSLEGGDIRNLIERSGPVDQCNAVVGPVTYGSSVCWICNVLIAEKAECEHKFGVLQSIFFTGLYDFKVKKMLPPGKRDEYLKLLRKEYSWSHERCNQVKRAASLVTFRKDRGNLRWVPDEKRILKMMEDILNGPESSRVPSAAELRSKGVNPRERTTIIATQHVARILDVANQIPTRTLLSGSVMSLRFRSQLLYPSCYSSYPPPPSVRGGGLVEYSRANQVLEYLIKRESATKLFVELDGEDIDVRPVDDSSDADINSISEILEKYDDILERKLTTDEARVNQVTDDQYNGLYDLADSRADDTVLTNWINANILKPLAIKSSVKATPKGTLRRSPKSTSPREEDGYSTASTLPISRGSKYRIGSSRRKKRSKRRKTYRRKRLF